MIARQQLISVQSTIFIVIIVIIIISIIIIIIIIIIILLPFLKANINAVFNLLKFLRTDLGSGFPAPFGYIRNLATRKVHKTPTI